MVAKNEPTSDREIIISRVINFPREIVWDAMTDPKKVGHWWGPRGFTTTIETMDVKPGGLWLQVLRGPDGTEFPNRSTFTEVTRPSRLVFVHSGGKAGGPSVNFVMTWSFDAISEHQTRVTIHQVYATAAERDLIAKTFGAIEGGRQTLTRLAEFVIRVGEPFVIERAFPAPLAQVWHAVSDRAAIERWFFDFVGFRPEPGCEFFFAVEHDGTKFEHRCQVTEVIPEKKIAYTWRYDGAPGDSLVTIELFPEREGTRLRLTHDGLDHFPKLPKYDRKNFVRGWTSLIGTELPAYLQTEPAA